MKDIPQACEALEKYVGVFPTTAYAAGDLSYKIEGKRVLNFWVDHESLIFYSRSLYIPFEFEGYFIQIRNEGEFI